MDALMDSRSVAPTPGPGTPTGETLLTSEQILQGNNEVRIVHGGCVYSLRLTRQGKLILTK